MIALNYSRINYIAHRAFLDRLTISAQNTSRIFFSNAFALRYIAIVATLKLKRKKRKMSS